MQQKDLHLIFVWLHLLQIFSRASLFVAADSSVYIKLVL